MRKLRSEIFFFSFNPDHREGPRWDSDRKVRFCLVTNLFISVVETTQATHGSSPPSELTARNDEASGTQAQAERIKNSMAYLHSGNRERGQMRKTFVFCAAWIAALLILPGKFIRAASAPAPNGNKSGPPTISDTVPLGTHFLVRLDDELKTATDKVNRKFNVRTLEPLETVHGYVLPPGARVHGHISRIETGGLTGRARLWLTFDEIETRHGRVAIVAEVSSVPGDFGVRQGKSKEGEIEARTNNGARVLEAAAAGAAAGAAPGIATQNAKAAATGAAAGSAAAFVAASSAVGQEVDLPKGTKIDLILDRPLYLNQ